MLSVARVVKSRSTIGAFEEEERDNDDFTFLSEAGRLPLGVSHQS